MIKPWRKHGEQAAAPPRIFRLRTQRFESPRNGTLLDAVVIDSADWVNVIALTADDQVVLVRQYRFGTDTITLEIPGGAVDAGESPLAAAQRELREETGCEASEWRSLGHVAPNPAFMNNRLHGFVALGCVTVGEPTLDPGEDIEVVRMPLGDVEMRMADGSIDHALVLALFLRFKLTGGGISAP